MRGLSKTILTAAVCALLSGCSSSSGDASSPSIRQVTLPDGAVIQAEVKITPADMQMGMMNRTSLAKDRGMLFVHSAPGTYPYWMANCNFPLDIIWMNAAHQVVEISAQTPPCPEGGSGCPTFGGHATAQYVLELGGGEAARHHVQQSSTLQF